jgi:hypothetical protein
MGRISLNAGFGPNVRRGALMRKGAGQFSGFSV